MRQEGEIFDDLAKLCISPGYAHAIAYFCFRDNFVGYARELTADDMQHSYAPNRLIRTEISTLIGLLIKEKIDSAAPSSGAVQQYIERTEALLNELHHSMSAVAFAGLDSKRVMEEGFNPLARGDALREPIFYGGKSAYSFQYRELAVKKYVNDDDWLKANKGFSIQNARDVAQEIGRILDEKLGTTLRALKTVPPGKWTLLPGFVFTVQEVSERTAIDKDVVSRVLTSFALPEGEKNRNFCSLHDFNVANGSPLIPAGDNAFILFQIYSLVEALYESPFYWMGGDKNYAAVAMRHRGEFTEQFSRERLELVFGKGNVHSNVTISESKARQIGEIDVLVLFGNRAIVLQAKSKRLTLEARRGNDGRIRYDFKKSIRIPMTKALHVQSCWRKRSINSRNAAGNEIAVPAKLKQVFIFCVVSDHYPALSFQARQFLKYETTGAIQPPFVMDVFALDAMTEMLRSPLYLLGYVDRRTNYSNKLNAFHELTILAFHLKQNLWLDDKYDLVTLADDISVDLDVAMTVRREGLPGRDTRDGILTRFTATPRDGWFDRSKHVPTLRRLISGLCY